MSLQFCTSHSIWVFKLVVVNVYCLELELNVFVGSYMSLAEFLTGWNGESELNRSIHLPQPPDRYNMTMGTTTWPIASYPCYNDFLFMMDSTLELWSKLNPSFVTLFKSGHFVTPVRQITKIRTVKFIYQPSSLSSKMIQSLTRKEIIRRYLSRFQLYSSLYSVMIEACYSC